MILFDVTNTHNHGEIFEWIGHWNSANVFSMLMGTVVITIRACEQTRALRRAYPPQWDRASNILRHNHCKLYRAYKLVQADCKQASTRNKRTHTMSLLIASMKKLNTHWFSIRFTLSIRLWVGRNLLLSICNVHCLCYYNTNFTQFYSYEFTNIMYYSTIIAVTSLQIILPMNTLLTFCDFPLMHLFFLWTISNASSKHPKFSFLTSYLKTKLKEPILQA